MTQLTGIKDGEYLAQFLGKKIAIKSIHPNTYYIFPVLAEIHYNRTVRVMNKDGVISGYTWDDCENPYILLQEDVEIILK